MSTRPSASPAVHGDIRLDMSLAAPGAGPDGDAGTPASGPVSFAPIQTRRSLPLLALDVLLTLLGWALFTWLLVNGGAALLASAEGGPRPTFGLEALDTLHTLVLYLLIGLVNALLLFAWARYNQYRFARERRSGIPALSDTELAASFAVDPEVCARLRRSRIATVTHDAHGGLAQVVCPAGPGAAGNFP